MYITVNSDELQRQSPRTTTATATNDQGEMSAHNSISPSIPSHIPSEYCQACLLHVIQPHCLAADLAELFVSILETVSV